MRAEESRVFRIVRMNADRPAKLADVALRAGVSAATVSRCLNSPDRVSPGTRARVLDAVAALGYAPNTAARALAARRSGMIGAVIPTMENAIFARGLQAFQEELDARGYTLLVASSSYREALEAEQIRTLAARGTDGLLLIGHHRDPAVTEVLAARGIPALVAWAHDPGPGRLPAIGFDNAAAMARLARAVLDEGHRRIGVISADTVGNDRARDRLAGIRRMLAAAGAPLAPEMCIETIYGVAEGGVAFDALMNHADPPTAVMCGNDVLAVGAMRAARLRGLSVPRDVSITGFDDIDLATVADPPLTTVHVPHREMGRRAAGLLVDMVGARTIDGPSVELEATVVLRGTLGPVPG